MTTNRKIPITRLTSNCENRILLKICFTRIYKEGELRQKKNPKRSSERTKERERKRKREKMLLSRLNELKTNLAILKREISLLRTSVRIICKIGTNNGKKHKKTETRKRRKRSHKMENNKYPA